jgi:hypothetical protein
VTSGTVLNVNTPGVLGNDTDIDSPSLQAQLAVAPTHGVFTLNANGSFSYTPAAGYSGPDSFSYVAGDGQSTSGAVSVTLTVSPLADVTPPSRSNGQPSGVLPVGTTQAVLSVSTNEAATCRYATTPGIAYASMPNAFSTTGGTVHTTPVSGLVNGTSFACYVRCVDGVGNQNSNDFTIAFSVAADTTAPTVAVSSPSGGASVSGTITVTASASDNVAVVAVQFLLNGVALGAEDTTAPYAVSWNTATAINGAHQLSARARDAANNQTTSLPVSVTVNNAVGPPSGLVAAYSFNEGSGTTLIDRTGFGRTGTVSGATWSAAGRFGGALSFDGVNDIVTIADHNSLDLTTGMTLEAWVRPLSTAGWRTVMVKNVSGGMTYSLFISDDVSLPTGYVRTSGDLNATGNAALGVNAWTHIALTYDGTTLRLYVGGAQVGSRAVSGSMVVTTGALTLGGNNLGLGYFQGLIDEVRIYNRALTPLEIQTDMTTAVTP